MLYMFHYADSFWFNETAIDIFNLISDCDDAENIAAVFDD